MTTRDGGRRLAGDAEPVAPWDRLQRRPQTVEVEALVAPVAQQQVLVVRLAPTDAAARVLHRLFPRDARVQASLQTELAIIKTCVRHALSGSLTDRAARVFSLSSCGFRGVVN